MLISGPTYEVFAKLATHFDWLLQLNLILKWLIVFNFSGELSPELAETELSTDKVHNAPFRLKSITYEY